MMLMEILHAPRKLHLENWRDSVELAGLAPVMDHMISGNRPLIVLTGHYGNWELAGFLFGMFGFPTVAVARTLDNPYLERYLRAFRERTGQSLDTQDRGLRPDGRSAREESCPDLPGRPGRRPARAFRRFLRSARLDPQGDRAARHRTQGARRRRRRAANRAGLSLRDPLRRRDRPRRARPARPTTFASSPSASRLPSSGSSARIRRSISGSIGGGSISQRKRKRLVASHYFLKHLLHRHDPHRHVLEREGGDLLVFGQDVFGVPCVS